MTVLSDAEILNALKTGEIKLEPSDLSACLNPAGYDLRCSETVVLKPKDYVLVATLETVELGLNIVAFMHIRSSLAREGIIGSFAVIDPGFRGQLTLHLHNVSDKEITLHEQERIVQIVFHSLASHAKKGYNGSYQDSKGVVSSKRNTT
ncbi:MAG: dCTP deaminase [Candidatus Bathyarchaeota archaeon]|nr:dCTP deaminase [Candidatus Bathyarchaeum sp.]